MAKAKFRKGVHVRFWMGLSYRYGVILEDRGPLGINGRHLYLVEFDAPPESPSRVELPADDMEVVNGAVATRTA